MLLQPAHPLSWKLRLAIVAVAALLALSLLEVWAGGIRFMKLIAHVAQQIAEQEMAKSPPPPSQAAPGSDTQGVVSVGILPGAEPEAPPEAARRQ